MNSVLLGLIAICMGLAQTTAVENAAALLHDGKFKEVRELAAKELTDSPNNPELLYLLGSAECSLDRYDDGIDHLIKAIQLGPANYRYEYRVNLESCIAKKHKPTAEGRQATAEGRPKPAQTLEGPFPTGREFSYSGTSQCSEGLNYPHEVKTTYAFTFGNGSVEYAASSDCRSDYYRGFWRRVGKLIYVVFPDPSGKQNWELTFLVQDNTKPPVFQGGSLPVFPYKK